MSDKPDCFGNPPPELIAKLLAQVDQAKMHCEDFHNRWRELILTMPVSSLATIQEMLSAVTVGTAEQALSLGNYFEGQLSGVIVTRESLCNKSDVSDIDIRPVLDESDKDSRRLRTPHHFMPSMLDGESSLYCHKCNLPLVNQIHRVPQ